MYLRSRKIRTQTHTGANWALRTLSQIWTDFFRIWQDRNTAIHGHDLRSQNQARHRRLRAEMELLHSQQDQVLAVDSDAFIENPAALETFLSVSSATHIQNWINVWRPLIISSIQTAKERSLQGVRTLSDYFVPEQATNT